MRAAWLVLGVVMTSTAGAQESVAPVLSRTLSRAQETDALKRVLTERHFRDRKGGLVSVKVTAPKTPRVLRTTVTFRAVGAMRQEALTLTCVVGFDGRLRRSGLVLVRGRDRVEAQGAPARVAGRDVLRLQVRETRGEHTESRVVSIPWRADVLPFSLAVFVLPLFVDQGLPATLQFRAFHPVSMALNPKPSTLTRTRTAVTLTDFVPGQRQPTVIRLKRGSITSIELGEHDRLTAISPAEAARLRGR